MVRDVRYAPPRVQEWPSFIVPWPRDIYIAISILSGRFAKMEDKGKACKISGQDGRRCPLGANLDCSL
jgi:hypothetical protein